MAVCALVTLNLPLAAALGLVCAIVSEKDSFTPLGAGLAVLGIASYLLS